MSGGIYKIENIINGKCYVGSAKSFARRKKQHFKDMENNRHGNIKLQNSVNKHGLENFTFVIIEELGDYDRTVYFEREDFWINKLNSKIEGYNIADAVGGDMISNHPRNSEIRELNSKLRKEHFASLTKEERSAKYGRSGKANCRYGIPRSPETLQKMHDAICGEKHWFYGKNLTPEHVSKIAKANTGKKRSQETKDLLSVMKIGSKNPMAKAVIVDNKEYQTITEASKSLGLDRRIIRSRIDSDKFENYSFK